MEYATLLQSAARASNDQKIQRNLTTLVSLESGILRLSGDSSAILPEIVRMCENQSLFHRGVDTFASAHPDLWLRRQTVNNVAPPRTFRAWLLSRFRPEEAGNENDEIVHFFELLREQMILRSIRVQRLDGLLRWLVQAESTIVNSRSQLGLAQSNLRLQRLVVLLTVVVLFLTIAQVYLAWIAYAGPSIAR
jgi:hypothetical protein